MKEVQASITYKMYIWPLPHILTQVSESTELEISVAIDTCILMR